MQVETRDGGPERRVLTGMITNAQALGRVAGRWKDGMFASRWANLVGKWCVDHWTRYRTAPGKGIVSLYEQWAAANADRDSAKLVDRFLAGLSEEYASSEDINVPRLLDEAARHFDTVALRRLTEEINADLDAGLLDKAKARHAAMRLTELQDGGGHLILNDADEAQATFQETENNALVRYPMGLGAFFDCHLERDAFIAFMAPDKSGKTMWLVDLAFRAVSQRRRTAYFSVGDLSLKQTKRRFYSRIARHPVYSPGNKWPYVVKYPTSIVKPTAKGELPQVVYEDLEFEGPLDWGRAWKACENLAKHTIRSKAPYLRVEAYPNSSVNVQHLRSVLEGWEADGWRADVIIIDYADILAPPLAYASEPREQINQTWKELRRLSMENHCLVVTASQSDAAAYNTTTLTRRNFSDDKRKLAHVTGFVGINVTPEEKEKGLCRLNWVVLREGEFNTNRVCYVAQCLPLANPAVCSVF